MSDKKNPRIEIGYRIGGAVNLYVIRETELPNGDRHQTTTTVELTAEERDTLVKNLMRFGGQYTTPERTW